MSQEPDFEGILSQFPTNVCLSFGRTEGGPTHDDPEKVADRVVVSFQFSEKGFGFGEITIIQTAEGCFLDTEHMNREGVKRYLGLLIDGAIADTDTDPEKHLLYNQVAGRRCGEQCGICYSTELRESAFCERTEQASAELRYGIRATHTCWGTIDGGHDLVGAKEDLEAVAARWTAEQGEVYVDHDHKYEVMPYNGSDPATQSEVEEYLARKVEEVTP